MIKCCYGCVAPKRHPGCHDHCPEYLSEKFVHDQQREEANKKKENLLGIYNQRDKAVHRAKHNSNWKHYRGERGKE